MTVLTPGAWALLLGVVCFILVLLMILLLCIHKVASSAAKAQQCKLSARQTYDNLAATKAELDQAIDNIENSKNETIIGDAAPVYEGIVNSSNARLLDNLLWHSALGRVAANELKNLFLRIDMVLNTALAFFINSLAGALIQFYYTTTESLISGWTVAILVMIIVMTMFGLISYHVTSYIETKLVNPGLWNNKVD